MFFKLITDSLAAAQPSFESSASNAEYWEFAASYSQVKIESDTFIRVVNSSAKTVLVSNQ